MMLRPDPATEPPPIIRIALGDDRERAEPFLEAAQAAERDGRPIVVDCGSVAFLPTSTIQILIALQQSCHRRGIAFAVERIQQSAVDYWRLAGLDRTLANDTTNRTGYR